MTVLITIVIVAAIGYVAVLLVRGFAPASADGSFTETLGVDREFSEAPAVVLDAYKRAVPTVPGMSLVAVDDTHLLIDSRPTVRVLSGDFGSVLVVGVRPCPAGSLVHVGYQVKSSLTFSQTGAAFREKERAMRMAAKRAGQLSEAFFG